MNFELEIFNLNIQPVYTQLFKEQTETEAKIHADKIFKEIALNDYYVLALWNRETDAVHKKHLGFEWTYQGKLENRTLRDIVQDD